MKTTNHKNKYFSSHKERLFKIVVVLIVVSIFNSALNINQTHAYFTDEVTMIDNSFTAGTLEINLDYTDSFDSDLNPGDTTSVTASLSSVGSLDSQYIVETFVVGSDSSACDYITMEAVKPGAVYQGLIRDFVYVPNPEDGTVSPVNIELTTDSSMDYSFTIDPNAPVEVSEKTCTFKWRYTAWQTNLNDASSGFTSVKEKTQEINIGEILPVDTNGVVLNEIYPNEYGANNLSDDPLKNQEFIELYNMSRSSIDVEGWSIGEFSGNSSEEKRHVISSMNTCASGSKIGFARPYDGASTIIPSEGLLVIELCSKNRLHDNGDTIILHDNNSMTIDSHSYPKTIEGKSNSRIPDGGSWVDPIPTPGVKNTATRLDLELEGWDNDRIISVLAELGVPDDNIAEEDYILEDLKKQDLIIENIEKEIIVEEIEGELLENGVVVEKDIIVEISEDKEEKEEGEEKSESVSELLDLEQPELEEESEEELIIEGVDDEVAI